MKSRVTDKSTKIPCQILCYLEQFEHLSYPNQFEHNMEGTVGKMESCTLQLAKMQLQSGRLTLSHVQAEFFSTLARSGIEDGGLGN